MRVDAATSPRLRLLTYNVHRGRSAIRGHDICERVAKILDFSQADIFCLQEVWQHDGFDRHQFEAHLCDQRWPHRVFVKTATFAAGTQGNAVVSRTPIVAWNYLDISVAKLEPRGILHAAVQFGDATVQVFCVHFGLFGYERRRQAALLMRFIEEKIPPDAPIVVAGDFNDWTHRLAHRFTKEFGFSEVIGRTGGLPGRTYPSFMPLLRLDRIYYRNAHLLNARIVSERSALRLSDHLPIEADFELPLTCENAVVLANGGQSLDCPRFGDSQVTDAISSTS